jgi:glutamate-1-semialdehyde 2,1-aminomutase
MDKFHWYRRAQDSIAQTALTNSKRPETFVKGVFPTHIERGQGAYLWDHSGKKYLDFVCGLGANILGYGNDVVNQAISSQLRHGASHSLPTHHEVEFAEGLKALFPFCDAFKFLKTGTEACMAAVKIARAKTGRKWIVSEGYHGWSDDFVSMTEPALGVEPKYDNRPILKLSDANPINWDETAAVIIEPVITDWSPERQKWLRNLREQCTKHGVMLIFDEIITGFRFPRFSVSSYFNVIPDIIVLGKAIANGMPLAAVGGKYDVMNGTDYFVSSTYAGETLSLVAGKATITALQNKYDLDWLWKQGQAFLDVFNSLWPEKITIQGYPTRGAFKGDELVKALFWQEACLAGILFGPSFFFNFALASEWKDAMVAIKAIIEKIKRGGVQLLGEMPKSPIAQKVRG